MLIGHSFKLPDKGEPLDGRYANYFEIGYNPYEFLIDFGQQYHEQGYESHRHTRIITNPVYARTLMETLQGALNGYEEQYGPVEKI